MFVQVQVIITHSYLKHFVGKRDMLAGEIISQVEGLTHDKLTYFVRAGYLNPRKIKKGTLNYNDFSKKDLFLVNRAWDYIKEYGTKTSIAFEKAQAEYDDPQMSLFNPKENR